jgi:hypothetical protein
MLKSSELVDPERNLNSDKNILDREDTLCSRCKREITPGFLGCTCENKNYPICCFCEEIITPFYPEDNIRQHFDNGTYHQECGLSWNLRPCDDCGKLIGPYDTSGKFVHPSPLEGCHRSCKSTHSTKNCNFCKMILSPYSLKFWAGTFYCDKKCYNDSRKKRKRGSIDFGSSFPPKFY